MFSKALLVLKFFEFKMRVVSTNFFLSYSYKRSLDPLKILNGISSSIVQFYKIISSFILEIRLRITHRKQEIPPLLLHFHLFFLAPPPHCLSQIRVLITHSITSCSMIPISVFLQRSISKYFPQNP